jgi:hypothetical protein
MHFTFLFLVLLKEIQIQKGGINSDDIYGFSYFRWPHIYRTYPNLHSAVIIAFANILIYIQLWSLLLQMAAIGVFLS